VSIKPKPKATKDTDKDLIQWNRDLNEETVGNMELTENREITIGN
jgi:hypothetical protein